MLVLSRKQGERIVIDRDITVEILEIDRGKVRLGIVAPKEVGVYREELLEKPQQEGDKSAKSREAVRKPSDKQQVKQQQV